MIARKGHRAADEHGIGVDEDQHAIIARTERMRRDHQIGDTHDPGHRLAAQ
jgi:hypothetical protein